MNIRKFIKSYLYFSLFFMFFATLLLFFSTINNYTESKFIFFGREIRSLADWPVMIAAIAITPILVVPLFLVACIAWRSISKVWQEMINWHK
jgi:hypothetical protein